MYGTMNIAAKRTIGKNVEHAHHDDNYDDDHDDDDYDTVSNKLVESRQNGQCRGDMFARAAVAVVSVSHAPSPPPSPARSQNPLLSTDRGHATGKLTPLVPPAHNYLHTTTHSQTALERTSARTREPSHPHRTYVPFPPGIP